MKSIRGTLPSKIPATAQGTFLGIDGLVDGCLVAIESYAGCVPTFTWQANSGHLFCFMPPHAFAPVVTELQSCVDQECPPGPIDVVDLGLEGPGFARVGSNTVAWKRYCITVDWYEQNKLSHLVLTQTGVPMFVRNERFQLGGTSFAPPAWKKMRHVWTLSSQVS